MTGRAVSVLVASVATVISAGLAAAPSAQAKTPGKVTKAKLTSVSSTAAALTWKVPKSSTATVVRVAKGKKAPKSPTSGKSGGTIGKTKHTVKVTHLKAGTVYSVSLFSKSGRTYSKPVVVRLQTAPAAVSGLYAQTSTTAITLRWQLPSRSASTTIVRYATGRAPATPSSGKAVPVRGRALAATLKGLRATTNYRFSLWAVDRAHRRSPRVTATFATARATTGGVAGVVVESKTGRRLRDVEVDLSLLRSEDDEDITTTAANGSFAFGGVKPGRYEIFADGYEAGGGTSKAGYVSFDGQVTIKAGSQTRLKITLSPAAGVSGRFVGAEPGQAGIAKAIVYARTKDEFGYFALRDRTTDTGAFTLTDLDPAETDGVCVDDSDYDYASPDTSTGHVGQCFDVKLVPGQVVGLGTKELAAAGAIKGTVTLNGADVAFVAVFDGTEYVGGGVTDENGTGKYKAAGLPAGKPLTVCVDPFVVDEEGDLDDSVYAAQCYQQVAWDGTDKHVPTAGVTTVQTTVHETKPGIDFALQKK